MLDSASKFLNVFELCNLCILLPLILVIVFRALPLYEENRKTASIHLLVISWWLDSLSCSRLDSHY